MQKDDTPETPKTVDLVFDPEPVKAAIESGLSFKAPEKTPAAPAVLAAAAPVAPTAPTRPAGPRRIWLCADDYGISPGVNEGIRELILRSRINATSVMVVAPSASDANRSRPDASRM